MNTWWVWGGQDNKEQAVEVELSSVIFLVCTGILAEEEALRTGHCELLQTAGVKDAFFYKWSLPTKIKNVSINRGRELE